MLIQKLCDFCFPRLCAGCRRALVGEEKGLCIDCLAHLIEPDNIYTRIAERLQAILYPIETFLGGFLFVKGGESQRIVHAIKYQRFREAGWEMGRLYAQRFRKALSDIDVIVPVPSSPQMDRRRGYTQTVIYAEGISWELGIPIAADALRRNSYGRSQTKRHRRERLLEMEGAFGIGKELISSNSHVLLLDDLLTTGATLTAATAVLTELPIRALTLGSIFVAE